MDIRQMIQKKRRRKIRSWHYYLRDIMDRRGKLLQSKMNGISSNRKKQKLIINKFKNKKEKNMIL